jgi:tetratricopeptide (TPR) repeat protein
MAQTQTSNHMPPKSQRVMGVACPSRSSNVSPVKVRPDGRRIGNVDWLRILVMILTLVGHAHTAVSSSQSFRGEASQPTHALLADEQLKEVAVRARQCYLAESYGKVGRLAEDIRLQEHGLQLQKEVIGLRHFDTLHTMHSLAQMYRDAGRLAEAIRLFEETYALRKLVLGANHACTSETETALGSAYADAGQFTKGLLLCDDAFTQTKARLGPHAPASIVAMCNLARLYIARSEYPAAETLLAEALSFADKQQRARPLESSEVRLWLGDCLLHQGQFDRAESVMRVCVAACEQRDAEGWRTFWSKSLLGASLLGQKQYARAEPLLVAGYAGMKNRENKIPVPERARIREAFDRIISLCHARNNKIDAASPKTTLFSRRPDGDKKP